MLGSIRTKISWQWLTCGKHPVAKDYFQIGVEVPLLMAFGDWIDKGYQQLRDKRRDSSQLNSWRFWAKGPKKNLLVCGVVLDSSDSIGRPFPLLIAGTGTMNGWQKNWDLLPLALENTWNHLAWLSTKRYMDLKQLEDEIRRLRPPEASWRDLTQDRVRRLEAASKSGGPAGWDVADIRKNLSRLAWRPDLVVAMEPGLTADPTTPLSIWHSFMKEYLKNIPNVVLMGGAERSFNLAIFTRALAARDFVRLWSDTEDSN